jgi:uncharacterized protein YjbI with pentapeptide repeats
MYESSFEEEFRNIDFAQQELSDKTFEECSFIDCNFSNCDLSYKVFMDCLFENCNFSMTKVIDSSFRDVKFKNCRLNGINFSQCNSFLFAVDFNDCNLTYAIFNGMNLEKIVFDDCGVKGVDFSNANLESASFKGCDLAETIFDHTVLENSDFRSAINYVIDPEINRIKKAKFSQFGLSGLLGKYDIEIE